MNAMQKQLRMQAQLFEKGGNVTRYHTHEVFQRQTVAEHTFNVLWILSLLWDGNLPPTLFRAALAHDIAECELGDIPAPMKRILREKLGADEEDVIQQAEDRILQENRLSQYSERNLSLSERRTLKMADVLDGLRYAMREFRAGNRPMFDVATEYARYFHELKPSVVEVDLMHTLTGYDPDLEPEELLARGA